MFKVETPKKSANTKHDSSTKENKKRMDDYLRWFILSIKLEHM